MIGDVERVLGALADADVQYLVVGGVAAVLHGHLRTTSDLDLVVGLERANIQAAVGALSQLGYRPRAPVAFEAFLDPENRAKWIVEKGLTVFSLWSPQHPLLEVYLFASEPFDFAAAWGRRSTFPLVNTSASVASINDLIALKMAAGRPHDLADIVVLRALLADGTDERS